MAAKISALWLILSSSGNITSIQQSPGFPSNKANIYCKNIILVLVLLPFNSKLCSTRRSRGEGSKAYFDGWTFFLVQQKALYSVHSILFTTQCKLHTANCTLHTAQCKLHTANCTLHTAHCKLNTANCTLHTSHCKNLGKALTQAPLPLTPSPTPPHPTLPPPPTLLDNAHIYATFLTQWFLLARVCFCRGYPV